MILCDACKRDPVREAASEAERANAWGLQYNPPPGVPLSPVHICQRCFGRLIHMWLEMLKPPEG